MGKKRYNVYLKETSHDDALKKADKEDFPSFSNLVQWLINRYTKKGGGRDDGRKK